MRVDAVAVEAEVAAAVVMASAAEALVHDAVHLTPTMVLPPRSRMKRTGATKKKPRSSDERGWASDMRKEATRAP
jgi:hypothetical protein